MGPSGPFAYVVGANQTVSMRAINLGSTEGTTAVITSGLQPGETVVTDGQMSLSAGTLVKAVTPAPAISPAQPPAAAVPATQTQSAQTPATQSSAAR